MDTEAQIARELEMYGEGAEMDLVLAKHFFALARGAETREDAVAYARAYKGCMRSMRQSLGYRGRLRKQEREHARVEAAEATGEAAPAEQAPPVPPAERARRKADLRTALHRVIWAEIRPEGLDPLDDRPGYLHDLLEERLRHRSRDRDFGREPLDAHIARLGADLGLSPDALAAWRSLPDPPFAGEDLPATPPHEDEDPPLGRPAWRSG
jgi:hypothetical protein